MKTKLYQLASTGRMKVLEISAIGNSLLTEWWTEKDGVKGKAQSTSETIQGMNQGKSNETTPEQQCVLEYERKVKKKKEEGYTEDSSGNSNAFDIRESLPSNFAPCKPISEKPENPTDGSWYAEKKFDGVCLILHAEEDQKRVYSRKIKDIYSVVSVVPDIKHFVSKLPANTLVVGELVATDKYGKENTKVLRGIASEKTTREKALAKYQELIQDGYTVQFKPYDLYFHMGTMVTNLPFEERNAILESMLGIKRDISVFTDEMIQSGKDKGWEGYILRHKDSVIDFTLNGKAKRIGGHKFKYIYTTDCIVFSMSNGAGKNEQRFARFHLYQYQDDKLVDCGWAGLGQLGEDLADEITNDFLNRGYTLGEIELQEKDWFAVELEYQERQKPNEQGQICFLFPVITRLRDDKPLIECVID